MGAAGLEQGAGGQDSWVASQLWEGRGPSRVVTVMLYTPRSLCCARRPPAPRMSNCSSRALTLLSSVFGACGLLLVGIAVSTDYWLYMEEGIVLQQNQTTEIKMALHAGLWRVCFFAGVCCELPPSSAPSQRLPTSAVTFPPSSASAGDSLVL